MTAYSFAPGVHACLADGRLVVLNTAFDRYLMLPERASDSVLRLIEGAPDVPDDTQLRRRLCTGGLVLQESTTSDLILCAAPSPANSLIDAGWPAPGPASVTAAGLRLLASIAWLRLAGLDRTLARVARIPRPERENAAGLARLAHSFAELRFAMRVLDRCLPLSVALATAAKREDGEVRLVLGVQCNPFAAHAWAQRKLTVLNDRLDTVRGFTPILAI